MGSQGSEEARQHEPQEARGKRVLRPSPPREPSSPEVYQGTQLFLKILILCNFCLLLCRCLVRLLFCLSCSPSLQSFLVSCFGRCGFFARPLLCFAFVLSPLFSFLLCLFAVLAPSLFTFLACCCCDSCLVPIRLLCFRFVFFIAFVCFLLWSVFAVFRVAFVSCFLCVPN